MKKYRAAIMTVLFLAGCIGTAASQTACATSPTGRKQVSLVSDDQLKQLGDQAWTETKQKYKPVSDPAVREFANQVASRIIKASGKADEHWDVEVFDSKESNAFALPGGHIGVFAGILPVAGNEAGLATVLGHEVGHVLSKHSAERVSQETLAQGALDIVSVVLGGGATHNAVMGALGLGAQYGVLLPYSRTQELEADQIGLILMAEAGYNPNEALNFWQRMATQSAGQAPPEFLSSHPSDATRIQRIQEKLPEALDKYAKAPEKRGSGERAPAAEQH